MVESLILFESVINSRWFLRTSIILFLNKIDVFKQKLPKVSHFHPTYTCRLINSWLIGSAGTIFPRIYWRFRYQQSGKIFSLEVHANKSGAFECLPTVRYVWSASCLIQLAYSLTQATDTPIIRLVFSAVKETTLQNALKGCGIL
jgi:guanine nucleotide-binding protein G(i) subunit alpha